MDTDKHRCAVRSSLSVFICLVATVRLVAAEPAAGEPAIQVITDDARRPVAFEAVGMPLAELKKLTARSDADEAFKQVFSVYVASVSAQAELPAMSGSYAVKDSVLRFTPRYPMRSGMLYRAVLRPDGIHPDVKTDQSGQE